jgi:hypothetical protein
MGLNSFTILCWGDVKKMISPPLGPRIDRIAMIVVLILLGERVLGNLVPVIQKLRGHHVPRILTIQVVSPIGEHGGRTIVVLQPIRRGTPDPDD